MSGREDKPPRLFSPLYWAAMATGVVLVAAGAAVALVGPHLGRTPAPAVVRGGALTGLGAHGRGADPHSPTP